MRNTRVNECLRALGRRGLSLMTSLLRLGVTDNFKTVSVGCTSYLLSTVKGGQIYFKTSHLDLLSEV